MTSSIVITAYNQYDHNFQPRLEGSKKQKGWVTGAGGTAKFCSMWRQQFHGSTKQVRTNLQKTDQFTFSPTIFKQDIQCMKHSVLAFYMLMRIAGQQRGTMLTKNLRCFTQLSSENSIHGKAGVHNPISSFHWQFHTSATLRPCWTFEIMAEHLSKKFLNFSLSRPEQC